MTMRVVHIRDMRVCVPQRLMAVQMRMRLPWRIRRVVDMLVVFVVNVRMGMLNRFMKMLMLMPLGEMQPDAKCHE